MVEINNSRKIYYQKIKYKRVRRNSLKAQSLNTPKSLSQSALRHNKVKKDTSEMAQPVASCAVAVAYTNFLHLAVVLPFIIRH